MFDVGKLYTDLASPETKIEKEKILDKDHFKKFTLFQSRYKFPYHPHFFGDRLQSTPSPLLPPFHPPVCVNIVGALMCVGFAPPYEYVYTDVA